MRASIRRAAAEASKKLRKRDEPSCPADPPLPKKRKSDHTSSGDPKGKRQHTGIEPSKAERLSLEIWEIITRGMCPSQLAAMSQVSKWFSHVITSLPVWKEVADAANLTVLTRGLKKTHFGAVMASSDRMCEQCFEVYKKKTAYDVPLPVFLVQHNKDVRLCLRCRTKHYRRNPEPVGPGDNVKARLKYGGQVGVDAQKRCSQAFCAKFDKKHRPCRARRRALIRAAFSEAGLTIDESITDVSKFIRNGCWNHETQRVDGIIKKIQAKQATQQRRLDLVQRLQQHNLRVRDHSRLCSTFIDHNEGHIDDIVALIVEANWFEKYTNYNELRNLCANEAKASRTTSKFYENTELGKMRALREYLTQRLMLGQWDDVSLDADTPKRPPESLWQRIRALTRSIWQEQTKARFLEAGVRQSPEVLLLDPDQASSLTNDLFIKVLHRGIMESTGLKEDDLVATPFSSSLRTVLGEDAYMEFIEDNRQLVLDKARAIFINSSLKVLPAKVDDFVQRCNGNTKLISRVYNAMEQAFIETEVPVIAHEKNVHPTIIISLLTRLKKDGCITCAF